MSFFCIFQVNQTLTKVSNFDYQRIGRKDFSMKKLVILTLSIIVLFLGANADADEIICGRADVLWINLWESDPSTDVPVQPCNVWIRFVTENNQGPYTLPATAGGTQINLGLLKALNYQENVSACLVLNINLCLIFKLSV